MTPTLPITFGVMCAADRMTQAGLQRFAQQVEAAGLDQIWVPELLGRDPFLTASALLSATQKSSSRHCHCQRLCARCPGHKVSGLFLGGRVWRPI